ncbi:MAG TPA: hypothetical protein VM938_15940 [Acidimicrobiales bacterium]|nr:hypothetical protein [Acidimicrobiales bacterium]
MTVTAETSWALARLARLVATPQPDLVELFRSLEPPSLSEADGEFAGYLPVRGLSDDKLAVVDAMYSGELPAGLWLGKAFIGTTDARSEGYNMWRTPEGAVKRSLRFTTFVGESAIDGKPSLVMNYCDFANEAAAIGLVDEVRKVEDGVYIGAGLTAEEREAGVVSGCFLLAGPVHPSTVVDDPDAERK